MALNQLSRSMNKMSYEQQIWFIYFVYKKIKQLDFISEYGVKELRLLLDY